MKVRSCATPPRPAFAFKILAAGRVADNGVAAAFRTAFQSMKPNDGVYVGVFPNRKDELKRTLRSCEAFLTGA